MSKVFNIIFRPNVRAIKVSKIIYIVGAIIDFILASSFFNAADKAESSGYYYWDSSLRSAASFARSLGILFVIIGLLECGMVIYYFILERNGRVCPKCEQIYLSTVAICPNCNIDISNAMGVKEYLKNKPTVAPKAAVAENTPVSAPKADTAEASSAVSENAPNRAARRFCPFCGKPTEGGAAFCSNCGKPLT